MSSALLEHPPAVAAPASVSDQPLHWVVPAEPGLPPLLLLRPAHLPPAQPLPLALCVHGYSRQPLEHLRVFGALASQQGFALALPLFDERHHRCYQQLLHPRRGTRSDLALLQVLEQAAPRHAIDTERLFLFGYSGGAQFVHRFAMRHPQRTAALAVAAAGWYTWPDPQTAWPLGMADPEGRLGAPLDLDAFLQLPMALWIGERDNRVDEQVRDHPSLLQQQGGHRMERAARWAGAVRTAAAARGFEQPLPLHTLPRAGHDLAACDRHGGLGRQVMDFFAGERHRCPVALEALEPRRGQAGPGACACACTSPATAMPCGA